MKAYKRLWKELKIAGMALVVGLALTLGIAARTYVYSETTQGDIARNVIRFHVLANSDSESDQQLKEIVRLGVLEAFKEGLNASNNVSETRAYLNAHLEEIRDCAEAIVTECGYDYPVRAAMSWDYFPTKAYGDVVFPPGNYEALRIEIGSGEGRNWWCVMFPPLCYVDLTQEELPEEGKQQLMQHLPEEEYTLLAHTNDDMTVTIRFKVVEWWQSWKKPAKEQTDKEQTQTVLK